MTPATTPSAPPSSAGLANIADIVARAHRALMPPPKLTLSEWADRHYYLSAISSAHVGRWKTIGYQRGMMDALTDPAIAEVYVMKSARIGWTKILNAWVGYSIQHDPSSMLLVQPTIGDAEDYSKEELEPMFEDCPVLEPIAFQKEVEQEKKKSNTMTHMRFAGGAIVSLVGAVSARGFRRTSRKRIAMDEVDAYEISAGKEGDPVKLALKRSNAFHDGKGCAGSTPTIKGASRIESLFEAGDQRRYFVPCPHCGHMDYLVWTRRESGGHYLMFDSEKPEDAHAVCSENGCVIEHKHKREMIERGEWRAQKKFRGKASFHIWAAYSFNPKDSWGNLAIEWIDASKTTETLKTFVNTVLGETWEERGDAPELDPLLARREGYARGSVPDGVLFLTCGVDVQQSGWYFEIVGWRGADKESWSIDADFISGDPNNEAEWSKLDELLNRSFTKADGTSLTIAMLAVDSGFVAQRAYSWVRTKPKNRVVAVKGHDKRNAIITVPTKIEVNSNGRKISAGARLWVVGTNIAKTEFYGWLRLATPRDGDPFPPGFVHFPKYEETYFKQITAEHLVSRRKHGKLVFEWHVLAGRENHLLDCRVYARAAAAIAGIDRMKRTRVPASAKTAVLDQAAQTTPTKPATTAAKPQATNRPRADFWASRRRR